MITTLASDNSSGYHQSQWLFLTRTNNIPAEFSTESDSKILIRLDGSIINNDLGIMEAVAVALKFPEYGKNWNAVYDFMTDLEWLPSPSYLFVWKGCSNLLLRSPLDFFRFLDIFSETSHWWHQRGVTFHLLLVDDFIYSSVKTLQGLQLLCENN